jgi:hypothetical protein
MGIGCVQWVCHLARKNSQNQKIFLASRTTGGDFHFWDVILARQPQKQVIFAVSVMTSGDFCKKWPQTETILAPIQLPICTTTQA